MSIQVESIGDVVIVHLQGMFRHEAEVAELETVLRRIIVTEAHRKVLVNVRQAEMLSSIALGVLGSVSVSARDNAGQVVLCGVEHRLKDVLSVIPCFGSPFEWFESCEEALETLQKP